MEGLSIHPSESSFWSVSLLGEPKRDGTVKFVARRVGLAWRLEGTARIGAHRAVAIKRLGFEGEPAWVQTPVTSLEREPKSMEPDDDFDLGSVDLRRVPMEHVRNEVRRQVGQLPRWLKTPANRRAVRHVAHLARGTHSGPGRPRTNDQTLRLIAIARLQTAAHGGGGPTEWYRRIAEILGEEREAVPKATAESYGIRCREARWLDYGPSPGPRLLGEPGFTTDISNYDTADWTSAEWDCWVNTGAIPEITPLQPRAKPSARSKGTKR